MNWRGHVTGCCAAIVFLIACGGSTKTLPKNEAGATARGGSGSDTGGSDTGGVSSVQAGAGDVETGGTAGEAGQPATIDGTWHGYVESYKFSDQSDAITLLLAVDGTVVTGQATFGMSSPPPPVTDPTVGYPPDLPLDLGGGGAGGPYPGFVFTIQKGTLAGARLQFDVAPTELWKSWCSLQTPIADEVNAGQWACVHNWGIIGGTPCKQTDPMTHQEVPVDCGRFRLCQPGGVCACTAAGCSAGLDGGIHFDLNVSLPKADGSVSGLDSDLRNVHLTKD